MSQQSRAKMLGVDQKTVSRDIEGIRQMPNPSTSGNALPPPAFNAGRPRGSTTKAAPDDEVIEAEIVGVSEETVRKDVVSTPQEWGVDESPGQERIVLTTIPTFDASRRQGQLVIWCDSCHTEHYHGAVGRREGGPRVLAEPAPSEPNGQRQARAGPSTQGGGEDPTGDRRHVGGAQGYRLKRPGGDRFNCCRGNSW